LNRLQKNHKKNIVLNGLLLLLTVLILLFFGLRQKDPGLENNAEWDETGKGLQFNNNSFAYSDEFITGQSASDKISIELTMKTDFYKKPRFSLILQIYDTLNNSQINIGQWEKSLVILGSNDFSNRKREPKIYSAPLQNNLIYHISVTSDKSGTAIYFNGELIKKNPDLVMSLPENPSRSHLILGNGITGHNPWKGTISNLAIYDRILSIEDLETHYQHWKNKGILNTGDSYSPLLLYTFDKAEDLIVYDSSGQKNHLIVPEKFILLKKEILGIPNLRTLDRGFMKIDIILNFLGFIPLGILLFTLLKKTGLRLDLMIIFITTMTCFLLSLTIELIQISMVGRDSSMLDLFLNSTGGYTGGLIASLIIKYKRINSKQ